MNNSMNVEYKASLDRISDDKGRLSLKYRGNAQPLTIEHSYSVLEKVLEGNVIPEDVSSNSNLKKIVEKIGQFTGPGKIPQNLAFVFSCEFPLYFDNPDFENGFKPINREELSSFIYARNTKDSLSDEFKEEFLRIKHPLIIDLSRAEEQSYFKSFNFYKKKLDESMQKVFNVGIRREAKEMIQFYETSNLFLKFIVGVNTRLVPGLAKKYPNMIKTIEEGLEYESIGLKTLYDTANKFNYNRGFKFSTYACRAILQNYGRKNSKKKIKTSQIGDFHDIDDSRDLRDQNEEGVLMETMRAVLKDNLADLDEREMKVINGRFGLGDNRDGKPRILKSLGNEVGVTKERIRQIETKALEKIREAMEYDLDLIYN